MAMLSVLPAYFASSGLLRVSQKSPDALIARAFSTQGEKDSGSCPHPPLSFSYGSLASRMRRQLLRNLVGLLSPTVLFGPDKVEYSH